MSKFFDTIAIQTLVKLVPMYKQKSLLVGWLWPMKIIRCQSNVIDDKIILLLPQTHSDKLLTHVHHHF